VLSLFLASVKATTVKEKDKEKMYGFEVITPSTSASFYVGMLLPLSSIVATP
jgi:hypothetical protein